VNLDGQRFCREQQLEQQCRLRRLRVRTLKPEFADRSAIVMDLTPGPKIGASPGFTYDPRAGMFDPDNILLIRNVYIGLDGLERDGWHFRRAGRSRGPVEGSLVAPFGNRR
jgi:hypothetical protein